MSLLRYLILSSLLTTSKSEPNKTCPLDCSNPEGLNGHLEAWPYVVYLLQGVLFGTANLLVVGTVVRHPILRIRKEYFMVAALAFADLVNELAFAVGGTYRLHLIGQGQATVCRSSWYCIMSLHGLLWSISFPLIYFMLLCVSIDRFLLVLRPLTYRTLTRSYSILFSAGWYFAAFAVATISVLLSYWDASLSPCAQYEAICLFDHALGHRFWFLATTGVQIFCSGASVVLYAFIPYVYKKQVKKLGRQPESVELIYLKAQRKLLVTLGFSSVGTFFLMVVPGIYRVAVYGSQMEAFPWAALVMNLNPALNTFLFIFRHKRFRQSFLSLICCRKLPPELRRKLSSF